MAHFQKALEIDPGYAEAHINVGVALAKCGRMDEAMAHFQKALEIDPDSAAAHLNLGIARAGCGRMDEAMDHFQEALEIKPDYADAHKNLGIALAGCGRMGEAMAHFQQALVLAGQQNNTALAEELRARLRADAVIARPKQQPASGADRSRWPQVGQRRGTRQPIVIASWRLFRSPRRLRVGVAADTSHSFSVRPPLGAWLS